MITKEIDVWVTENIITEESPIPNIVTRHSYNEKGVKLNGKETIRARLIIELPERKREITESEFEEAFRLYMSESYPIISIEAMAKRLKDKLFENSDS